MRFPSGPLAAYPLGPHMSIPGERAVEVSMCPSGSYAVILSGSHLLFITCTTEVTFIGSFSVCNAMGDEDYATHLLWHPSGEQLIVSTHRGRLLYFDVVIDVLRERPLSQACNVNCLHLGCTGSRILLTDEVDLGCDNVVSLVSTGSHCFFAITATGGVRVLGWLKKSLLHAYDTICIGRGTYTFCVATVEGTKTAASSPADFGSSTSPSVVLDICYSCGLELIGLLSSCGQLLLLDCGSFDGFSFDNLSVKGVYTATEGASGVCLNPRHPLVVLVTPVGELHCKRLSDDYELVGLWNGVRCSTSDAYHGSIRCMVWADDGETLCVGYNLSGVQVLHYSGACLYSSHVAEHPGYDGLRSVIGMEGCSSLSWCGNWLFAVDSRGLMLTVFNFCEVISSPCGDAGASFTPACMFDGSSLYFIRQNPADGSLTFNDVVPLNPRYTLENNPMRYGAVSSDGTAVALAGRNGFMLFDRSARRLRCLRNREVEREFACVAPPIWLKNLAVVFPVQVTRTCAYELRVYGNRVLVGSALLARVPVQARPLCLSECHGEDGDVFLHSFDISGTLLVWRCDLLSEAVTAVCNVQISLVLVGRIVFPKGFLNPVSMTAIHPTRLSARGVVLSSRKTRSDVRGTALPHVLFTLRGLNALIAIDLNTALDGVCGGTPLELLVPFTTVCSCHVFHLWVDYTTPLEGCVLLVVSDKGVGVVHIYAANSGGTPSLCVSEYYVGDAVDTSLAPIGLSTYDGCLLTAYVEVSSFRHSLSTVPLSTLRVVVVPSMYNYRILREVIDARVKRMELNVSGQTEETTGQFSSPPWCGLLLRWVEGMRCNGTLVWNGDYLLRTLFDRAPLAYHDRGERHLVTRAALSLLRRYPEYHRIVVNCLRKLELPSSPIVVDNIGSTVRLFMDCLEGGQLDEASHMLHLVMVDDGDGGKDAPLGALRQAMVLATRTLLLAMRYQKVQLIYTLVPFTALLFKELMVSDDKESVRASLASALGYQDHDGLTSCALNLSLLLRTEPSAAVLESPWGFSHSASGVGVSEIRSLTTFLLCEISGVSETLERAATECLQSGRLLTFYEMMRGFFISPRGMMELKLKEARNTSDGVFLVEGRGVMDGNCLHMVTSNELFLTLFSGIHEEFGLARSPRSVEAELQRYGPCIVRDGLVATDFVLWTVAQYDLYSTPGLVKIFLQLRDQFAIWDECVLAFNAVLMLPVYVIDQLRRRPELVQVFSQLLVDEKNRGYEPFVRRCLHDLG